MYLTKRGLPAMNPPFSFTHYGGKFQYFSRQKWKCFYNILCLKSRVFLS
uniref:Uncharacterized protein n=1 Tax=Bartonella rochalimae ATCC BAA-1498 TaxID=685782 RepID=E6YN90_9HYPH|nr:hypothetical protein BARRO_120102 [Bartonella rochalimae ATCC BAA-1498]